MPPTQAPARGAQARRSINAPSRTGTHALQVRLRKYTRAILSPLSSLSLPLHSLSLSIPPPSPRCLHTHKHTGKPNVRTRLLGRATLGLGFRDRAGPGARQARSESAAGKNRRGQRPRLSLCPGRRGRVPLGPSRPQAAAGLRVVPRVARSGRDARGPTGRPPTPSPARGQCPRPGPARPRSYVQYANESESVISARNTQA